MLVYYSAGVSTTNSWTYWQHRQLNFRENGYGKCNDFLHIFRCSHCDEYYCVICVWCRIQATKSTVYIEITSNIRLWDFLDRYKVNTPDKEVELFVFFSLIIQHVFILLWYIRKIYTEYYTARCGSFYGYFIHTINQKALFKSGVSFWWLPNSK